MTEGLEDLLCALIYGKALCHLEPLVQVAWEKIPYKAYHLEIHCLSRECCPEVANQLNSPYGLL